MHKPNARFFLFQILHPEKERQLDNFLFRVIRKDEKYSSLYPSAKCEIVALGEGNTDFSVEKMVQWITQHQDQTKKVAKALEKSSLENTCASIHDHLYWNFQYKADAEDQLLRSPACAWKQRFDGIDCKSYSILASSILLNLGINHYIKKVGYTQPNEFTHVYVVVPINQETNDLNDGYYMIDGTINTMDEPFFLVSKETLMLSHYGLNAPQLNGFDFNSLKNISLNKIQSLFNSVKCIGGSGYTESLLNTNVTKLTELIAQNTENFNKAILERNYAKAGEYLANFAMTTVFIMAHVRKRQDGWNPCSERNFDAFIKIADNMENALLDNALPAYINKYFTKTNPVNITLTNVGLENQGFTFMEGGFSITYTYPQYTLVPKTDQIPAFEFTQPLIDTISNGGGFNTVEFLSSLQNVLQPIIGQTNPDLIVDPNTGLPENNPNKDSGFGFGGLALTAGGIFLVKKIFFA